MHLSHATIPLLKTAPPWRGCSKVAVVSTQSEQSSKTSFLGWFRADLKECQLSAGFCPSYVLRWVVGTGMWVAKQRVGDAVRRRSEKF